MTTVRGTIRSTNTITADGRGNTQGSARAAAIAGLNLVGHEVVQANTVSSTAAGDIIVRAIARSTETRTHEASGADYDAALAAYRSSVPDGWASLHIAAYV